MVLLQFEVLLPRDVQRTGEFQIVAIEWQSVTNSFS